VQGDFGGDGAVMLRKKYATRLAGGWGIALFLKLKALDTSTCRYDSGLGMRVLIFTLNREASATQGGAF
jgi:hypothetical protein